MNDAHPGESRPASGTDPAAGLSDNTLVGVRAGAAESRSEANSRLIEKVGETIRVSREVSGAVQEGIEGSRYLAHHDQAVRDPVPGTAGLPVRPQVLRAATCLLSAESASVSCREHPFAELLFLAGAAVLGSGRLAVTQTGVLRADERRLLNIVGRGRVVLAD
jgi:hypothetical protein